MAANHGLVAELTRAYSDDIYLAATACYVISPLAINRLMAFIERRIRVSGFVVKGFYFSTMLTVVATIGGVMFGPILALMRLSGKSGLARWPRATSTACEAFRW